jgi:hypothetical protein
MVWHIFKKDWKLLWQLVVVSLAKMPSGLNAFEISDIQEEQTDAGRPGRSGCNIVTSCI